KHPEKVRSYQRRWDRDNAEQRAEYARQWREQNRGKTRAAVSRRRAILKGARSIPFTADQLDQRMSMFGCRCWMCGGPFEHMDHVKPLSRGGWHCLSNLRPSCARCNKSKADKWPVDVRRHRTPISP